MKKSCCITSIVLSMGWLGCSKAPAPLPQATVTVQNDTDAHDVQVFWTASQCGGIDVQHNAEAVCHQEVIGGKKSSTYTFEKGTTGRTVLVFRPKDYCALVGSSDLKDFSVAGDEALRTDGCVLQKDSTRSAMLSKATQ